MYSRCILGVVSLLISTQFVIAQEIRFRQDSIFIFGGIFTKNPIGKSLLPLVPRYEDNFILGAAFQRKVYDLGPLVLGWEVGGAGRFGESGSGEVWGSGWFRFVAFSNGNIVITPGMGIGLSAVTNTIGIERQREIAANGNATLLGHLSPEIAVSFRNMPNMSLVYRIHHRSGLFGHLFKMNEGHNAQVIGIRWSF